MNVIDLATNLPSEHASVSFPECPVSYCVSCEPLCINWNEPQAATYITHAAFQRGLSMSWWMQTESALVSTRSE